MTNASQPLPDRQPLDLVGHQVVQELRTVGAAHGEPASVRAVEQAGMLGDSVENLASACRLDPHDSSRGIAVEGVSSSSSCTRAQVQSARLTNVADRP